MSEGSFFSMESRRWLKESISWEIWLQVILCLASLAGAAAGWGCYGWAAETSGFAGIAS